MKNQFGFGLIEVVIAFVLVAVSAGSLLQLHKVYLEYSRDGRHREVALRLAESKLDALRMESGADYQALSGSPSPEMVLVDEMAYALEWTVSDYGWSGSAWVTPAPPGRAVGKKEIGIAVSWQDGEEAETVFIESTLAPNTSFSRGPFGTGADKVGLGVGGPGLVHASGSRPNTLAIELGDGLLRETSQPLSQVTRQGDGESGRVSISTVVYDGAHIKQQQQDLVSVSCLCSLTGSDNASLPAVRFLSGERPDWGYGGTANKPRGIAANHQDPLCGRCCAHHVDGDANEFGHWYDLFKWQAGDGPHGHYAGTPGNWTRALSAGSSYLEACRLVRIDGFHEIANDWNLVAFNIFDTRLLLEPEGLAAYRSYVKTVAEEHIRSQVKDGHRFDTASYYAPPSFSSYLSEDGEATRLDITPGPRQLTARGIYVDMVSPDYRAALLNGVMNGNTEATPDNLLKYAPFYEVNLTLLADWHSNSDTIVSVTSEPVQTLVNSSQSHYGVYSRGLVEGRQVGETATITATIRRGNSGMTAFRPLSAFEQSDVLSSSLAVTVLNIDGQSSVSGQITCIAYGVTGQNTKEEKCSDAQFSHITVSINGNPCGKTAAGQGGNQAIRYVCHVAPGDTATLTANAPPDAGYVVIPPPPAPAETNAWTVEVPDGSPGSVAGGCLLVVVAKPESVASPASCET